MNFDYKKPFLTMAASVMIAAGYNSLALAENSTPKQNVGNTIVKYALDDSVTKDPVKSIEKLEELCERLSLKEFVVSLAEAKAEYAEEKPYIFSKEFEYAQKIDGQKISHKLTLELTQRRDSGAQITDTYNITDSLEYYSSLGLNVENSALFHLDKADEINALFGNSAAWKPIKPAKSTGSRVLGVYEVTYQNPSKERVEASSEFNDFKNMRYTSLMNLFEDFFVPGNYLAGKGIVIDMAGNLEERVLSGENTFFGMRQTTDSFSQVMEYFTKSPDTKKLAVNLGTLLIKDSIASQSFNSDYLGKVSENLGDKGQVIRAALQKKEIEEITKAAKDAKIKYVAVPPKGDGSFEDLQNKYTAKILDFKQTTQNYYFNVALSKALTFYYHMDLYPLYLTERYKNDEAHKKEVDEGILRILSQRDDADRKAKTDHFKMVELGVMGKFPLLFSENPNAPDSLESTIESVEFVTDAPKTEDLFKKDVQNRFMYMLTVNVGDKGTMEIPISENITIDPWMYNALPDTMSALPPIYCRTFDSVDKLNSHLQLGYPQLWGKVSNKGIKEYEKMFIASIFNGINKNPTITFEKPTFRGDDKSFFEEIAKGIKWLNDKSGTSDIFEGVGKLIGQGVFEGNAREFWRSGKEFYHEVDDRPLEATAELAYNLSFRTPGKVIEKSADIIKEQAKDVKEDLDTAYDKTIGKEGLGKVGENAGKVIVQTGKDIAKVPEKIPEKIPEKSKDLWDNTIGKDGIGGLW